MGNSALQNTDHSNDFNGLKNTGIGTLAGEHNVTGNENTFLGYKSDVCPTCSTLTNVTAIGANCIVPNSNELILGGQTPSTGQNNVRVGIGLSGDNSTGLGPSGPRKPLEINADPTSFVYTGGVSTLGESGLRFRQLTDISTPSQNTGPGLLSVGVNGDVVYVDQIGNYCGAAIPSPLKSTFEVPLNRSNYYFSGQGVSNTDVIVGFSCTVNPLPYAKFQSWQMTTQGGGMSVGGNFYNSTNDAVAVGGLGLSSSSQGRNIGLYGITREYIGKNNIGVLGETVSGATLLAGNLNVGVYGYAKLRSSIFTHNNYAIVGDLGTTCAACTSGTAAGLGDFAGYFNGDIFTTAGFYAPSDSTLKDNVQDITNPMDILNALNPKSYTFRRDQNESMQLPEGTHYGIMAQNVAAVLPYAVKDCIHPARLDTLGNETHPEIDFLAVNNDELIPFLVAAIKEQQQTIEMMQLEIANLGQGGNRQGNPGNTDEDQGIENSIDVNLSDAKAIILNQNVPNPFAEQTTISYFITDDVSKAQIFFYDNKGTILKVVDIREKGAGQLNVFAADLSSGTYKYTLIADGNVIETKTMVKQ